MEVSGRPVSCPSRCTLGKQPQYPLKERLGGPQSRCVCSGQEITFSSAGIRTQDRPARTLAYNYYDIPASSLFISMCMNVDGLYLVYSLNPLNTELNLICCLLAILGAHHFFHVSRIRVKSLTLRLLMSYMYIYIYMEHPFLMFLDHTQRRTTVGRTPLDE